MIKKIINFKTIILTISLITIFMPIFNIIISADNNDTIKITIYHTNDMHGNVNSVYDHGNLKQIGLDVIKSVKNSTKNSILIDAGDALQGTALGKYSKGIDIVSLMNEAGYDGMTLGNHEFDYGKDTVKRCAQEAKFPVVSANILENGEVFLNGINGNNGCNFIKEIEGKRIGFFGITTEETTRTTIPPNLEGIEFKDELETAREEVKKLKSENVDAIVGIVHIGVESSTLITSREIAKNVDGIDLLIDGHSHTKMTEKVNNTIINQTGATSVNLGKAELSFKGNKLKVNAEIIPAQEIGINYTPDSDIKQQYDKLYAKISPTLERVIGKTESVLYGGMYGGKNISRFMETNLGDLICDAMVWSSKEILSDERFSNMPIVAFENGGAVRSKIGLGYITMADVLNVLPLDNKLTVQIITPKKLYAILERGVGKLTPPKKSGEPYTGPFGGFPQVSGIKMIVDLSKNSYNYEENTGGERISRLILTNSDGTEGELLSRDDDNTKIILLCNDYTIYEFPSITNEEISVKGEYLSDILAKYITELTFNNGGRFKYNINNKRVLMDNNQNDDIKFDGKIKLSDVNGAISNKEIELSIDNSDSIVTKSDDNGEIVISFNSGGHIIKILYNNMMNEVYLNNMISINEVSSTLTDKSEKEVISVINIIDQINNDDILNKKGILEFARISYDSLGEDNKNKIINYSKLQDAEKQYENGVTIVNEKILITIIIILSILLALVCLVKISQKKSD